jgi:hydroxymethylbilane synthase
MKLTLRIATRKSPLALWQANLVKACLQRQHPMLAVELLAMLTTADKMYTTPLDKIGGKALFVKELEKAILEQQADIAVHSMKDLPAELPDGLRLAVIMTREDPRDAFVANSYQSILDLPKGAVLGTSSLRRRTQALAMRQDLIIQPLRGNVGSRLEKLANHEFDGIILAVAGLKRLNLEHKIASYFTLQQMLPAAGQGAIGIECRSDDQRLLELIAPLQDRDAWDAVSAERSLSAALGGSCQLPIASFARVVDNQNLFLNALVGNYAGTILLKAERQGPRAEAKAIGLKVADDLIAQGALELLNAN